MPPAPPTFSTMTCWLSTSDRRLAMTRPSTSVPPPAAKPTTMVTGRFGQFCAETVAIPATVKSAVPNTRPMFRMSLSPHCALAPENVTTLPHFSVSAAISLPNSAGVPGIGVQPRSA